MRGLQRREPTLREERDHDIGHEALASGDLGHDLERNLDGHQVGSARVPVALPTVTAPQEVLILNVDEVLCLRAVTDGTERL